MSHILNVLYALSTLMYSIKHRSKMSLSLFLQEKEPRLKAWDQGLPKATQQLSAGAKT